MNSLNYSLLIDLNLKSVKGSFLERRRGLILSLLQLFTVFATSIILFLRAQVVLKKFLLIVPALSFSLLLVGSITRCFRAFKRFLELELLHPVFAELKLEMPLLHLQNPVLQVLNL